MDFTEKLRLKGKAEEDLYFAELDRQLIDAMHKKTQQEQNGFQPESMDNVPPQTTPGK
ncbi:hypothetical protein [Vibrio japonicus]|uniref:Uncharacterized protein n=1 Tax=Vibrio japonicus TaxID=1824638 RepID=A0ABY5LPA8_9VIBR|nr:hypothetical protein [Vibrio japonicus]UUM32775.1 hypothetical protein NP165_14520 [Vibrio japonicus]